MSIIDAYYNDTRYALEKTKLPGAAPGAPPAIAPAKVMAHHVVSNPGVKSDPNDDKAGLKYRQLSGEANCIAALGCIRIIQDSLVTKPVLGTIVNDPKNATVKAALSKLDAAKQPRGFFTSQYPAPSGKESLKLIAARIHFR